MNRDLAGATAAIGIFCVLAIVAVVKPDPMPPPPNAAPEQTLQFRPANPPIAVYTDRDRTLTVSPTAPRDLLVCLRNHCALVEEWVEGRPVGK